MSARKQRWSEGVRREKKEIKRGRNRNQWRRRETRMLKKWRLREENIKKDKVRWQLKIKGEKEDRGQEQESGSRQGFMMGETPGCSG